MSVIYSQSSIDALITEARQLQGTFDYEGSNRKFTEVVDYYLALGDECASLPFYRPISFNYFDLGEDSLAILTIDNAIRMYDRYSCEDTAAIIDLYATAHWIIASQGNAAESLPYLEQAEKYTQLCCNGATSEMARIHRYYAGYYADIGANYLAVEAISKSMEIVRKLNKPSDDAYLSSLYSMANYTERIGLYETSYTYLDSVIQFAPQNSDRIPGTYHMLSLISLRKKEYELALNYAELALSLFDARNLGNKRSHSFAYQEMGTAKLRLGDIEGAIQAYQSAYNIRNNSYGEFHRLTLSSLSSLTKAQMAKGDTLSSINSYKSIVQAFAKNYEVKNADKYVLNTIAIGDMYRGVGEVDSALNYYNRALGVSQKYYKKGDRTLIQSNLALAQVGEFSDRMLYLKSAHFHLTGDSTLNEVTRAEVTFFDDKYSLLHLYLIYARNLMQSYQDQNDLGVLKEMLASQESVEIIKEEVFYQFVNPKSISKSAPLIRELASLYLEASVILFEEEDQLSYLESALAAMSGAKNLELQARIFERSVKSVLAIPDSLIDKERRLYLSMNEINNKIKDEGPSDELYSQKSTIEKEYFNLRRQNLLQSKRLQSLFHKEETDIALIQKKLPAKTLVVNYFLDQNQLYYFFLTEKESGIRKIEFTDKVANLLEGFTVGLTEEEGTTDDSLWQMGYELYQLLLPIELMGEVNQITILPDNQLFLLPFDVLLTAPPKANSRSSELPFLIKTHSTNYLSQLRFTSVNSNSSSKKVAGFAPFNSDSTAQKMGMPRLNYSVDELDVIGDIFDLRRILGTQANEEAIKQLPTDYDILHIASHAVVDDGDPLRSNILFYPLDSSEDGRLELWELYSMDIPSELAVLSACQTADGTFITGSGFVNIARGFYAAGTNEVVSNLWPVQDFAASQMMQPFYRSLKEGKTPSESLRLAKLDYLNNQLGPLAHPFYWAGWMIQGNHIMTNRSSSDNMHIYIGAIILLVLLIFMAVRRKRENKV